MNAIVVKTCGTQNSGVFRLPYNEGDLLRYLPRSSERLMARIMIRSATCRQRLACAISEAGTAKLTQLMHAFLSPLPRAFRIIPFTTPALPLPFLPSASTYCLR